MNEIPGPLADRLKYYRNRTGMSQSELAVRLSVITGTYSVTRHDVSRWERGKRTPVSWLPALAEALGVGVSALVSPPGRAQGFNGDDWERMTELLRRTFLKRGIAAAALPAMHGQRAIQALDVIGTDRVGDLANGLGELIDHYAQTISAVPPTEVYDELLALRSYARMALDRAGTSPRRTDLAAAAGWLSHLLAVAAGDMGQHAAARVWCSDAERCSEEIRHPELGAWAVWTRSMTAFYMGQPRQSVRLAVQGRLVAPKGTVVRAKLASQEMRAAAMTGDASRMIEAKEYASRAIAELPSTVQSTGAFSIALGDDPPYTATSLLLVGRFQEAVAATKRVIQTVYQPETQQRGDNPSGYARSLLILGLAYAGDGHLDDAIASGQAALAGSRPAWPTLALADKLDQTLMRDFHGSQQTAEYHARYVEAASCLDRTDEGP